MWWYDENGEREVSDLMSLESRASGSFRSNTISTKLNDQSLVCQVIEDVTSDQEESDPNRNKIQLKIPEGSKNKANSEQKINEKVI